MTTRKNPESNLIRVTWTQFDAVSRNHEEFVTVVQAVKSHNLLALEGQ